MIEVMGFNSAPKYERIHSPETAHKELSRLLAQSAERQNVYLAPFLPEDVAKTGLLDSSSALRADVFSDEFGGPFSEKQIEADRAEVYKREKEWSAAAVPSTQKFYRERYGANTEAEIIAQWKKNREVHDGTLAEMALTVLFQKFLGDEFLVMRTNAYDDYTNHVDNIVIEKSTGAVLCTFDEFIGASEDDRFKKKIEKERNTAEKNGTTIKYGIALEKNSENKSRFVQRTIRNIPAFTLRMDKDKNELFALITELGEDLDIEEWKRSRRIFSDLVGSLSEQVRMLRDNPRTNPKVLEKINEFSGALAGIAGSVRE